ncbi:response regulator [Olivibacter jilunii]|uniref:response regulator n=1 Tax=Olivibacter jilunii TaxID=985016 RepID=UPI003F15F7C9
MKICIVDDDPIFQLLAKKQFQKIAGDIDTVSFTNGIDAYAYFRSVELTSLSMPKLLLVDLNLPIMNGWQLIDKLRRTCLTENTHIYIVSSSPAIEDRIRSLSLTCVKDYLMKPIYSQQYEELYRAANVAH